MTRGQMLCVSALVPRAPGPQLCENTAIPVMSSTQLAHAPLSSGTSVLKHKVKDEIIRNFKYIRTGKVKRYFEETRDIYKYSYEEYKPPYLVTLINQFLDGNPDAIDRILKYDISTTSNIDDKAQQSMELYYNQLIGLISFNLIDSLSISELSRIESFLEIELANKVVGNDSKEKSIVKSLKKV